MAKRKMDLEVDMDMHPTGRKRFRAKTKDVVTPVLQVLHDFARLTPDGKLSAFAKIQEMVVTLPVHQPILPCEESNTKRSHDLFATERLAFWRGLKDIESFSHRQVEMTLEAAKRCGMTGELFEQELIGLTMAQQLWEARRSRDLKLMTNAVKSAKAMGFQHFLVAELQADSHDMVKARKRELRQTATERLDSASQALRPSKESTIYCLQRALETARGCGVDMALVEQAEDRLAQAELENDLRVEIRRGFSKRIATALESAEDFVSSLEQGHGRNLSGLNLQMKLARQKIKEEEQVEEVVGSLVGALRNGGKCKTYILCLHEKLMQLQQAEQDTEKEAAENFGSWALA